MLLLKVGEQTLDIANASFNLTLKSPVDDNNAGSYVFSVSIPYSQHNAAIFGFPYRLTRMDVLSKSLTGSIIYNNINVQRGEWQAKTSTSQKINIEMVIGSSHFNTIVDGHNLPEYFDVYFDYYPSITSHANGQVQKNYPEVNHNFPCILNPSFYGDKNTAFSGVMNDYVDGFIDNIANYTNAVPQLYLLYIIKRLYEQNGYTPFGKVFDDRHLKKAWIYNNYAIDDVVGVYFSARVNQDLIHSTYEILWDTDIDDPIGQYTQSTGYYKLTSSGKWQININLNVKLNSMPSSGQILGCYVQVFYGSTAIYSHTYETTDPLLYMDIEVVVNNEIEQSELGGYIYVRVSYVDIQYSHFEAYINTGFITIVNTSISNFNKFGHRINYKNHVPDMGVKTFLTHVFASCKILPFFDHRQKTVELVFLRDMLNDNQAVDLSDGLKRKTLKVYENDYDGLTFSFDFQGPDSNLDNNTFKEPINLKDEIKTWGDLPLYPVLGDIYYITTLNAYYEYSFVDPEETEDDGTYEWLPVGDKHPDVIYNDGLNPITTQLAPLLMRAHVNKETGYVRNMPSINALGYSDGFGVDGKFPLRVCFWDGLKHGINTGEQISIPQYPFSSSTKFQTDGIELNEIDWKWDEIITRYYIPVITWWQRRQKIEFTNLVTPEFIANLDYQSKFFFQKTKCIFTEIVVKISNNIFGPGSFKGWG